LCCSYSTSLYCHHTGAAEERKCMEKVRPPVVCCLFTLTFMKTGPLLSILNPGMDGWIDRWHHRLSIHVNHFSWANMANMKTLPLDVTQLTNKVLRKEKSLSKNETYTLSS
jgi:hypothetical protein